MAVSVGNPASEGDADVLNTGQGPVVVIPAESFDLFEDVDVGEVVEEFVDEGGIQVGLERVIGELIFEVRQDIVWRVFVRHGGVSWIKFPVKLERCPLR